jgi:hypothetical protein
MYNSTLDAFSIYKEDLVKNHIIVKEDLEDNINKLTIDYKNLRKSTEINEVKLNNEKCALHDELNKKEQE